MSKLTALLDELCPEGVEYRSLGEVAGYVKDRRSSAELDPVDFVGVDNLLPDFQGVSAPAYGPNTAKITAFVDGDILIGNIRPYLKKIWLANRGGGCSGDVLALRISEDWEHSLEPPFLYRVLASEGFFGFNMQHARGGKMPRGDRQMILRYPIPVPPLEVQQEIVRVLDAYTDLTQSLIQSLEQEITLRRKQYEFYRNDLLIFKESTECVPLRDVAEYVNGKAHERLVSEAGTIPLVTARFISSDGEANRYVKASDIRTSAQAGDIALVLSDLPKGRALARAFFVDRDNSYAINQRIARIRVTDRGRIDPRFLFYVLDRNRGLLKYDSGFDQTHLSKSQVTSLRIPVPPLEVQQEIVRVLDAYTDLEQRLLQSIEQEISLRRQQYEFYRDELLSFAPKED